MKPDGASPQPRFGRSWRVALVVVAVSLVVVGFVAVSSGFQTWAARRVLASQSAVTVGIDQVSVGWGRVELTGVDLEYAGVKFHAPRILARLPVWQLARKNYLVREVVAEGWTIELNELGALAALFDERSEREVFAEWPGLLVSRAVAQDPVNSVIDLADLLEIPVGLALENASVRGSIVWAAGNGVPAGEANLSVSGTGLTVDQTGMFTVEVDTQVAEGQGVFDRAKLTGELEVQQATLRRMRGVTLWMDITAQDSMAGHEATLGLAFSAESVAGDPRIELSVRGQSNELVGLSVAPVENGLSLGGEWRVALSDEDLRPVALGHALPRFGLEGQGRVTGFLSPEQWGLDGLLEYYAEELGQVRAELSSVERIEGAVTFSGNRLGRTVRVTEFGGTVNGTSPVAEVSLSQGIEYDFDAQEVRVSSPDEGVFQLDLHGLPLRWTHPWTAPMVLDGRPASGQWQGKVSPRGVRIDAVQPLFIADASVANDGRSLLSGLDVSAFVAGEMVGDGWQLELSQLLVSRLNQRVAGMQLRGGKVGREDDTIKIDGSYEVDLARVTEQPIWSRTERFSSGNLAGEFRVGYLDRLSLATTLFATDLATSVGNEPLPDIGLEGRVDLQPDGSLEAHLPIRVVREERASELTFNAQVSPRANGWDLQGSLTGQRIYVRDLAKMAAPFSNEDEVVASAAGSRALQAIQSGSGAPPWARIQGSLQTAIGWLEVEDGLVLQDLSGELLIAPEKLELANSSARVGQEGRLDVFGEVQYLPGQPASYVASAEISAASIAAAPVMRTLRPDQPPLIEGNVDLSATIEGNAAALADLQDALEVQASVRSAQGVLRALNVEIAEYARAGNALASVASLFGAATGNARAVEYAERFRAASMVAEELAEMTYDQLNLQVSREAAGDLRIEDLSLISPNLRIVGAGLISQQSGVPVWLQPLAITLNLSAREEIATALQTLKLLKTEPDGLGYLPFIQDIVLDGSLADIGSRELETLLQRALQSP